MSENPETITGATPRLIFYENLRHNGLLRVDACPRTSRSVILNESSE
jgi:hypothetical protein